MARGPFLKYTPVRGTVVPIRTVYLDALVSGQVARVFVEVGASVASGDPLLRLTNADLELQVMQQEAELARMEANLEVVRQRLDQLKGLAPGERVITSSYESFGDEMDVLVLQ